MTNGSVSKPKLIYLEGNIGSRKTKLMEICRESRGFEIIKEPVGKWQDFYGHNMLQLKYWDKSSELQLTW
jgi:hypothetical protein